MALRRDRAAIGGIGFGGRGRTAELGYALGRRFWGRGYATEGVRAMAAHAAAVGYRRLEAFSFLENPASVRVLEKAGFAISGVVERDYPERGGVRKVRRFVAAADRDPAARLMALGGPFAAGNDPIMLTPLEGGGSRSWSIASSAAAASRCRRSASAR